MSDRISKAIILIGFVGAVWVTNVEPMVGRLPDGTALSSYGSRPQAVAPVPASIAIAEQR